MLKNIKISINKDVNKSIVILTFIFLLFVFFLYFLVNVSKIEAVFSSNEEKNNKVYLGGEAVGIKLLATGVLVMGIDRDDTLLEIGDVILSVNNEKISSNIELLSYAKKSNGDNLKIKVNRKGKEIELSIKPLFDDLSKEYKLGLWVKDSSAGVGTITFYTKDNEFAALGHGVTETKENYILPIESGGITPTEIYSIQKGISKSPGQLKGTLNNNTIGDIIKNTNKGIYGKILDKNIIKDKKEVEILSKNKIKEKEASIFCTLDDNTKKEYKIVIQKVLQSSSGNKNIIIKIIDKDLLEKTGGIVQGMSGSPILQNGKLVGAITHVFLNDPTRGYAVFAENMLNDLNDIKK